MHRKIAKIKSKEDIKELKEEFSDRFGIPSEEIDLYMHEKLFEYLAKDKGIEKVREFNNIITFTINKKKSSQINGKYLFLKANDISRFILFEFKKEKLNIMIDPTKLDRHYLYYIVDLLEIM